MGHSLEKLALINQELTTVENLHLPNLRELYLQKNRIKRLEGFEGCPKLRRLWIFSNDIRVVENLHCLGDLRELWLQDNPISSVGELRRLRGLQERYRSCGVHYEGVAW